MSKLTNILVAGILIGVVAILFSVKGNDGFNLSSAETNFLVGPATVSTASISIAMATGTSNTVASASGGIIKRVIVNPTANALYLYFTSVIATGTATSTGLPVAAGGTYTIESPNVYVGTIRGIMAASTGTITVIDFTK